MSSNYCFIGGSIYIFVETIPVLDFWSNFGVFKSVVFVPTSANGAECQKFVFNNFGPPFVFQ